MTDTSTFASAPADPGLDMVAPDIDGEEASGDNRRRMILIGAVVGVLVLAAAAYLLLHKSGSGSPSASGAVPRGTVAASTAGKTGGAVVVSKSGSGATKGKSASHAPKTLPKVVHHPSVRDPFAPLVIAPVQTNSNPASTTTVQAPTSTTPSTAPTTGTTTPITPVTIPTSGTTTTTGSGTTTGSPVWIQLMSTKGTKATFKVGYSHHKFRTFIVVAPKASSSSGTVFDKEFALIGVQSGSVTIQEGDDTPFDLAVGVTHVV